MHRRQIGSLLCAVGAANLVPGWVGAADTSLRFALGQTWGAPFVERDGQRVHGGLLPELMTGIAQELGLRPELVLLPPSRVEGALADGSVELQCVSSPEWWKPLPPHLGWSVPLMVMRDVLVAAPDGPSTAAEVAQGGPWTLSTVRGYHYPNLMAAFDAGHFLRDDSPDQWSALSKVQRSRTALAVVNELTLQAFNHRKGNPPLRVVREVGAVAVHCVVSDRGRVPPEAVKAAIAAWVKRGGVKDVLARYR